jgi:hypothetical protein
MSASDRCAKWRDQYPTRATVLRSRVMRLMGMDPRSDSPFALKSAELTENDLLCAVYGIEPDPIPVPPLDPPPLQAAKKALDLEDVEHPLTGRDRATGERDD